MAADAKWYFTKEQLANSPSRRCGIDADKELSNRQQAANFIQDMGQRLSVTQLCINTAIVYMHRFFVFHSLTQFPRNKIAAAALFLAAKTEEQPRKLEHVIKCAHLCLHRDQASLDMKSDQYLEQANELVSNESALLMTLGFELAIDHPHTHVVRCCHLVKANKDLAQTSYFMASNSLHLTTMCLQYKPTVVACFCIHLACKWSNWEIPQSNEGKHWFWYIDKTVTSELLQKLTAEFLHIFDKCPSRLKRKIKSINDNQSPNMSHQITNSPFELEPRKIQSPATDGPTFPSNRSHHPQKHDDKKPTMPGRSSVDYREYREKKERERLEREKAAANAAGGSSSTGQNVTDPNKHHSHHHKQQIPGSIMPNKQAPTPNQKSALHHNHHHRPDMKLNPSLSQRHTSSTSQTRDPNRDPNRQRVATREFNSGTSGTLYHHNISQNETNLIASQPDLAARLESGLPQESASHSNPQDKLSNNNHNVHRVSSHDKRYDPRHNKLPEHRKDEQKVASYPEYRDMSRVDRQRKPDSLEQRSEEVRKLIEKPLPPPKTRQELTKDDYIAHMLKQSHHSKHNQSDKLLQGNSGQNLTIPITPQMQQQQQQQQQQKTMPKPMGHQHSMSGMQQFIKNGSSSQSSSSMSNVEDPKAEKRPRHDEKTMIEQQNVANVKPKSLFSPEKIQRDAPRDSHQRSKSRQKTPPAAKIAKQQSAALDLPATLISPFSSPPGLQQQPQQQQQQQHDSLKRPQLEIANSSHKRHRGMNEFDQTTSAQDALSSVLNATNNIPGLLQPINELPSRSSFMNDTKMPELLRPFEPESTLTHRASLGPLTNGIESRLSRQEFSEAQEFPKAQEFKVNQDFKPIIDQVNFKATQDYKLNQELKVTQDFKSAQDYKQLQDFKSVPDFKINQEYKHEVPKVHDFPKNIFDFKDGMEFPRATVQLQRLTDYPKVKVEQPKTIPECSKNQSDFVKQELQEFLVTQDPIVFPKQEPQEFIEPIVESKKKIKAEPLEEFSRTKSAQSISALLQEPLAPMPSLLQQFNQPPQHQQQIQEYPPILSAILPSEQSIQHETQQQQPQQQQQHQQPPPLVSTVDMGALSGSTIDSTLSTLSTTSTVPIMPVVVEEKKSEHHKSEKKKKEKKHKHKDKEKSKEKHKHKHKDKDKEKHRDKDRKKAEGDNMTAEPIKITIPKDKINLTSESLGSVDKLKSPPGKIKIKIAKERIKVTQSIQQQPPQPATIQPLKIKIRTDAISRGEHDTRKRERSDGHENLQSGPPNKKQQQLLLQQQQQQQQQQSVNPVLVQQQQQQQQQRSNERQNGRHYNSGSNNKVRGIGRGGRLFPPRLPYVNQQFHDGFYQRFENIHGPRNPLHRPTNPRDPFFFSNYPPPPHMFNNPAGYMYDPAIYYQQYQQQQQQQQQQQRFNLYPAGNVIVTPDVTIDTSIPPPILPSNLRNLNNKSDNSVGSTRNVDSQPPLPDGPPPGSSPPPPPPPPPE